MTAKIMIIRMPMASGAQNGQSTHSHDQQATGWIASNLRTTNTIPMTVRQPIPPDFEFD
jgi:hypothetical protein